MFESVFTALFLFFLRIVFIVNLFIVFAQKCPKQRYCDSPVDLLKPAESLIDLLLGEETTFDKQKD